MTKVVSPPDYPTFLVALKERIQHARISAARSINRDLVLLYWDIGQRIVEQQQTKGWGDAVVKRLAADLRAAFPGQQGFSVVNLWRMQQFYLVHTSPDFLSQAVRELKIDAGDPEKLSQAVRELVTAIPWGHPPSALSSARRRTMSKWSSP